MSRGYIDGKEVKYGIDWANPEDEQESRRKSRIRSVIDWLRVPGRQIFLESKSKDLLKEIVQLRCSGCRYYPSLCNLCYAVSQHDDIMRREKEGNRK